MRKKKRTCASSVNKPPIEFEESPPIHVRLLPATPVHSSLYPLTADIVPVDDITSHWVTMHCQLFMPLML